MASGYAACTQQQKAIVDIVLSNRGFGVGIVEAISSEIGVARGTVKSQLGRIYRHYEIDRSRYSPMVRMVYLRFRELGKQSRFDS